MPSDSAVKTGHDMSEGPAPELWVNATQTDVAGFDPNLSVLMYLREHCGLPGTKEGCGSGDCGACTVLVRDPADERVTPVNACITPLGAVLGRQIVTVEGVGAPGSLHPVQQAMVDEHGSQCGFCTPGFVMSLVAAQLRNPPLAEAATPHDVRVRSISGNLCRCTGYRPILSAAARADQVVAGTAPVQWVPAIRDQPRRRPRTDLPPSYARPTREAQLQALLARLPDRQRVPLVAGATDLWLEVSQRYRDFEGFIDVSAVAELRRIETRDGRLVIGAAVTLEELLDWFGFGMWHSAAITGVLERFGSPQIRARGTVGGNLANASPIADLPPILLALGARVHLVQADGSRRLVPLGDFYSGYRETVLRPDEYLAAVDVPEDTDWPALQAGKISKRRDDDISSTVGAFYLPRVVDRLGDCGIAFGGVAATPVRFVDVEALLSGQVLDDTRVERACELLAQQLAPISDVRASAGYRRDVSVNLLRKALDRVRGRASATLDEVLSE